MPQAPPPEPPFAAAISGVWFAGWIFATVITPAFAAAMISVYWETRAIESFCCIAASLVLVVHLASSIILGKNRSVGIVLGLLFGGWGLMAISFLATCLVGVR